MSGSNTLTVAAAVSTTPAIKATAGPDPVRVRILSDRLVFIYIGSLSSVDQSIGYPLPELTAEHFDVPANANIVVVTAVGEPSGTVWITPDRNPIDAFFVEEGGF